MANFSKGRISASPNYYYFDGATLMAQMLAPVAPSTMRQVIVAEADHLGGFSLFVDAGKREQMSVHCGQLWKVRVGGASRAMPAGGA